MKRIFIDTNILIDYIDNRAGADDAEQIFACGFSGEALLFVSSLTFANMAYIIKNRTQEEKYDALRRLSGCSSILPWITTLQLSCISCFSYISCTSTSMECSFDFIYSLDILSIKVGYSKYQGWIL